MINFFKNIKSDWVAHGRSSYRAGFRVLVVYRFGNWRMTIKPKLLRVPFSTIYRFLERRVRFKYGIELPYTVILGERVIFEHQHGIVIHGNCIIGNDCIIRQGVTLGNKYLDKPFDAPKLGNKVNVGAGAKILGAVTIGDGVTIGANAVVITDVAAGDTVVGIPAKVISKARS
ncbi:MAG: serine acetyltransferase [Methylophaga sp.]|nr:MAG: serine acetyltransferase [Methylophaga sp.]